MAACCLPPDVLSSVRMSLVGDGNGNGGHIPCFFTAFGETCRGHMTGVITETWGDRLDGHTHGGVIAACPSIQFSS